ncbi:MAG TPA: peptidoglycan-binding domain-containing protein [Xanthobacteraceae bacterium]|nr:peptidoglycan-binding domain-containing protein [Xanthobacteraceae bacterium]
MSSRIDTLEPNGEPLAALLASIVARISSQDFAQSDAFPSEQASGDIARHAQRAIAGVPLGVAKVGNRIDLTATLRSFVAARMGAAAQLLHNARRELAAAVPVLRDIGATALQRLRDSRVRALSARLRGLAGNSANKVGAGLALAAVGLALVLVFASGRLGQLAPPSNEGAPSAQPPGMSAALAEERPPGGAAREFTRANLRYCTFQQIRLEALGPITEGADLVVFNALVDDWNGRCTKYHYRSEDKDAVDAEAGRRRALLGVEGRALMNVWRRKIVTTVQQRPASGLDAGATAAAAEPTSDPAERLPLLITLGRATAEESDRETGIWLRTPALALLRADVAMRVQRRLNDLGYTVAPVDGTWGSGSRAALRRFKKANGLLDNDAFDAETVTRLFSASATKAAADQRQDETTSVETVYPPPPSGDMNPLNRVDGQRIQQRLADLGYYSGRGDGGWDNAARAALRRFKAANGLGNTEAWDAPAEAVLFDEQAVRADAAPSEQSKSVAPPATAAVRLPPKRPAPPAKTTQPAAAMTPSGSPRPPGFVPVPARVSGAATRASP